MKSMEFNNSSQVQSRKSISPYKGRIIDIAILCTIGAGLLYFYGYLFWQGFLLALGAHISMLSLSFESISVKGFLAFGLTAFAAWNSIVMGSCLSSTYHRLQVKEHHFRQCTIFIFVILVVVIILPSTKTFIITSFLGGIVIIYLRRRSRRNKKAPNVRDCSTFKAKTKLALDILFFSSLLSIMLGFTSARMRAAGDFRYRLSVTTKNKLKLPDEMVLLAYLGDKYLVCEPIGFLQLPEVIIINDNEVLLAKIWKKPKNEMKIGGN